MSNHHLARLLASLVIAVLLLAPSARGELTAWDQAEVTGFAKKLTTATDALYDTFVKQPQPSLGSMQSQAYYRLKQWVRMLKVEAREFATSLEKARDASRRSRTTRT